MKLYLPVFIVLLALTTVKANDRRTRARLYRKLLPMKHDTKCKILPSVCKNDKALGNIEKAVNRVSISDAEPRIQIQEVCDAFLSDKDCEAANKAIADYMAYLKKSLKPKSESVRGKRNTVEEALSPKGRKARKLRKYRKRKGARRGGRKGGRRRRIQGRVHRMRKKPRKGGRDRAHTRERIGGVVRSRGEKEKENAVEDGESSSGGEELGPEEEPAGADLDIGSEEQDEEAAVEKRDAGEEDQSFKRGRGRKWRKYRGRKGGRRGGRRKGRRGRVHRMRKKPRKGGRNRARPRARIAEEAQLRAAEKEKRKEAKENAIEEAEPSTDAPPSQAELGVQELPPPPPTPSLDEAEADEDEASSTDYSEEGEEEVGVEKRSVHAPNIRNRKGTPRNQGRGSSAQRRLNRMRQKPDKHGGNREQTRRRLGNRVQASGGRSNAKGSNRAKGGRGGSRSYGHRRAPG